MFDFAKNKEVADITVVPENLRPFYEKQDVEVDDSPFVLRQGDSVVSAAVAMITSQQSIVVKERKIAKEANAKATAATAAGNIDLSPLSTYGADVAAIVDGVNKQITVLEGQIKNGDTVKTQIETLKKEMTTSHAKTLGEKDGTIADLTGQLDNYMLNTEIAAASTQYPELNPSLIAPFAKQRMQVEIAEDEKTRRVVILDGDGQTKFSMDRPGERMNTSELLQEMAKDPTFNTLFPSTARSGGGGQPSSRLPNASSTTGAKLSPAQKIAAGLSKKT